MRLEIRPPQKTRLLRRRSAAARIEAALCSELGARHGAEAAERFRQALPIVIHAPRQETAWRAGWLCVQRGGQQLERIGAFVEPRRRRFAPQMLDRRAQRRSRACRRKRVLLVACGARFGCSELLLRRHVSDGPRGKRVARRIL